MRSSCRLTLAALVVISWLPVVAQSRVQRLQDALPSMLDSTATSGISIALIEDGKVTWSKGLGVKDKQTKEAVSKTTIFRGLLWENRSSRMRSFNGAD